MHGIAIAANPRSSVSLRTVSGKTAAEIRSRHDPNAPTPAGQWIEPAGTNFPSARSWSTRASSVDRSYWAVAISESSGDDTSECEVELTSSPDITPMPEIAVMTTNARTAAMIARELHERSCRRSNRAILLPRPLRESFQMCPLSRSSYPHPGHLRQKTKCPGYRAPSVRNPSSVQAWARSDLNPMIAVSLAVRGVLSGSCWFPASSRALLSLTVGFAGIVEP